MSREERGVGSSALSDLMREMGSPNGSFDGIPPDNYLEQLDSDDPEVRILAWVRQKTIGKEARSPWAVDERGNELYLSNLAADCGYPLPHASAYVEFLVKRGVIRTEKVGKSLRIGLCGKVARKGRRKTNVKQLPVHVIVQYILNQVNNLTPALQAVFWTGDKELNELEREGLAVSAATVREAIEAKRLQFYASLGIQVKTRPDVKEKAAAAKNGKPVRVAVQVSLFDVPVQVTVDPEQVTETTCTDSPNGAVQMPSAGLSINIDVDVDSSMSVGRSSVASETDRPTDPPPSVEQARYEAIEAAITPASEKVQDPVTPKIVKSIDRKLSGAPVENLVARIKVRWSAITSLAFVRDHLADDVGKVYREHREAERKAKAHATGPAPTEAELAAMEKYEDELRKKLAEPVPKRAAGV